MCCINQHVRGKIRVEIQLMVWKYDLVLYLLESNRINPFFDYQIHDPEGFAVTISLCRI